MAGFGGSVKLTGESEYRKALKQIQTNLKEVSSEMRLVSAQFDKNDDSVEALTARSEALAKTYNAQKSALITLESQYSKLSAEQAKNQANHNKLVATYDEANAELQRLGKELGTDSSEYKAQAVFVAQLAKEVNASSVANEKNELTLSNMRIQMNDLKTSSGQSQLFFTMHIGIRHRTGADHALLPLGMQGCFKQLRCILFDFDIFKGMGKLIAPAPAVAVNTAVGTAAVDIHPIAALPAGQDPFRVHKMHLFSPMPRF